MKLYDVSMLVHEGMAVYKNLEEKKPVLRRVRRLPEDGANETLVSMNVHTGTHIDAPCHMIEGGAGIETLELEKLNGRCRVLDLTAVNDTIGEAELKSFDIREDEFILFKTRNSFTEAFQKDFVFLDGSGAGYLAERKIRGVGTDALGIERGQPGHNTHRILMSRGITIIEGLRLKDVAEGEYILHALPLKIKDADGAPARVVLIGE